MDRYFLLISIFTGLTALALLAQAFVALRLYAIVKETQGRVNTLADRIEPLIATSRQIAEDTRRQVREILAKATEITEATRVQVVRIDELMAEVAIHTRTNLDLADRLAASAAERVDETLAHLQRTILAPVRGINGAAAAVKAVVTTLGRRRSVNGPATQEEDLFI
jgi:methyl-accepting chemotaxis protein